MRIRYKLLVLALIPALAFLLSWAGSASGSVRPSGHAASLRLDHRRCSSTYDFGLGLHNDENGGQADWEVNTCNPPHGYDLQTRVQCGNYLTGTAYYHKSGEVHRTELDAWAACNFGDYVVDFWVDPHDTNHWVDV